MEVPLKMGNSKNIFTALASLELIAENHVKKQEQTKSIPDAPINIEHHLSPEMIGKSQKFVELDAFTKVPMMKFGDNTYEPIKMIGRGGSGKTYEYVNVNDPDDGWR